MWSSGLSPFLSTAVVLCYQPALAQSAESPPITPAPNAAAMPRGEIQLGEYARHTTLNRYGFVTDSGELVITTETVQELEAGGHLTVGAPDDRSRLAHSPSTGKPDRGRESWRALVLRQKDRVTEVRGEIVVLDARIAVLRSTTFSGRDGAARRETKLAELMGVRSVLSHQLSTERARLVALIRSAREQGAEPGWFR